MAYKTANRAELDELAKKIVGPTLDAVAQEHKLLKAQQMRFEIALKKLEARQRQIVHMIEALEEKVAHNTAAVLKRAAELEDKL